MRMCDESVRVMVKRLGFFGFQNFFKAALQNLQFFGLTRIEKLKSNKFFVDFKLVHYQKKMCIQL